MVLFVVSLKIISVHLGCYKQNTELNLINNRDLFLRSGLVGSRVQWTTGLDPLPLHVLASCPPMQKGEGGLRGLFLTALIPFIRGSLSPRT